MSSKPMFRASKRSPENDAVASNSSSHPPECDVEFRDVTKRYGDVLALDSVNLQVRRGEFLSLLGPSGCGKTTSLRVIAGSENPTSGRVLIGGSDAGGVPPHKRSVNTVFQNYALFPHLSVVDNIGFGLKQRGISKRDRRRQASEALELVNLGGRERSRPADLSGGEQQRVALARALVLRPRVLLLDEPLAALDKKLRQSMEIELKRIHVEVGLTFLFVTHDQGEAMSMSDRVAVMNRGAIEQIDTPQRIYDAPLTEFVAGFVGDLNTLSGRLVEPTVAVLEDAFPISVGWTVTPAAPGSHVRIGIRPEQVKVLPAARPDAPMATIVAGMPIGHEIQHILELSSGARLIARQHRMEGVNTDLEPGAAVDLEWGSAGGFLLGASDGAMRP